MAGPSPDRARLICNDPMWIRGTWTAQESGPRPPLTSNRGGLRMATVRLTVAQALVRFLANQYSERDGVERRLVTGCWGIFGHGNVAGVAQALLEAHHTGSADMPYYLARNEQGMVHA